MARAPLTARRLLGLDRSAVAPETLRGQPLRPLTVPNAIGFVRLALVPVFLSLALSSDDGRTTAAAVVFAVIGGTDYLDGMLARITGQYSRLGALLDPLVDRLLVLSGVIVTWHFELLPRWALALLAARELFVLVLTRVSLSRGYDLEINAWGRWAVWPTMFSIFLAMITETWVSAALLLLGVAMALTATAIYLRPLFAADGGSPSTSA